MSDALKRRKELAPSLRYFVLGVLTCYIMVSGYLLWRTAVLTPYSDELGWIRRWRRAEASGDWFQFLLAPYNSHRLPFTFGLLALDIRVFRGTNAPLILSGVLSLAGMAWAMGRQAARAAPHRFSLVAAAIGVMLVLMASNVMDASQPICALYTHSAALSVMAIILAEGGANRGSGWRTAGAIGCALAAGLGNAAGLAIWPVLAWSALRRGDRRWLVVLVLVGGLFVGVYASGQETNAAQSSIAAIDHPLDAVRITLAMLALPWGSVARAYSYVPGFFILMFSAFVLCTRGGNNASSSERMACSFILFSIGTALMTGLGRTGLISPVEVPVRYAIFITPLHVGFVMLLLQSVRVPLARYRHAAPLGIMVLLIVLTGQNLAIAMKMIASSDLIRTTVLEFRGGHITDKANMFVSHDFPRARETYRILDNEGLFQDELHLSKSEKRKP